MDNELVPTEPEQPQEIILAEELNPVDSIYTPNRGTIKLSRLKIKFIKEFEANGFNFTGLETPQYLIDKWKADAQFWPIVEELQTIGAKAKALSMNLVDSVCLDALLDKVTLSDQQLIALRLAYQRLQKQGPAVAVQVNNNQAPQKINFEFGKNDEQPK